MFNNICCMLNMSSANWYERWKGNPDKKSPFIKQILPWGDKYKGLSLFVADFISRKGHIIPAVCSCSSIMQIVIPESKVRVTLPSPWIWVKGIWHLCTVLTTLNCKSEIIVLKIQPLVEREKSSNFRKEAKLLAQIWKPWKN